MDEDPDEILGPALKALEEIEGCKVLAAVSLPLGEDVLPALHTLEESGLRVTVKQVDEKGSHLLLIVAIRS